MNIGERIRDLRKQNNLNQSDLAVVLKNFYGLGTDRVVVSKWETGFQLPGIQALMAIADYFKVPLDYFAKSDYDTENTKKVPYYPRYPDFDDFLLVSCDCDADLCLCSVDDCMQAFGILKGSRVFVNTLSCVNQGDIVAVLYNNKMIIRKYYQHGTNIVLVSGANEPPVMCAQHDIKIVGKIRRICYDFN